MESKRMTSEQKRAFEKASKERDEKLKNGTWDEKVDGEKPPRGIFTTVEKNNNMNGNKLKPCPFCGKNVQISHIGVYGYDLHLEIRCCAVMCDSNYENEDCITNKWNSRCE